MASNQRENERAARKNAKARKIQNIIWIILAVVIVAIIAMKVSEIDFKALKSNMTDENGKLSLSALVSDEGKFPVLLDSSGEVTFDTAGNQLAVLSNVSYTVVNSGNANVQYSDNHGFANPIMRISGSYAVIFDQGTDKYRLDSATENIYTDRCKNPILCADVSNSGIIALATTSNDSKSEIVVHNKSLKEKLKYNVNDGYVTAIAIDDSSSRIAFAAINSENAKLKTTVYTMNINDEKPRAEFVYEDSAVLDLHFSSSDLYVVGSDFVSIISSLKDEKRVFEHGKIELVSYCYNSSDELVIAYADYKGSDEHKLAYITPSGKIKTEANAGAIIKDISASKSKISVLTSDDIVTYNTKGEEENRIAVDDSYSSILQLSSSVYAKHHALIEIFKR